MISSSALPIALGVASGAIIILITFEPFAAIGIAFALAGLTAWLRTMRLSIVVSSSVAAAVITAVLYFLVFTVPIR